MDHVEIWPNGEIEVTAGEIDGKTFVRISFPGDANQPAVTVGFGMAHFVAFADHCEDAASRFVAESAARGV